MAVDGAAGAGAGTPKQPATATAMADFPNRPVSRAHCVAAAAVALAYAATRARLAAEATEREMQLLMESILKHQADKVDAKTAWLEGGCDAAEDDDEEEEGGDKAPRPAAAAAANSLHAKVREDTRYLLKERERIDAEAARLLATRKA